MGRPDTTPYRTRRKYRPFESIQNQQTALILHSCGYVIRGSVPAAIKAKKADRH
jgi:hypothetical protein